MKKLLFTSIGMLMVFLSYANDYQPIELKEYIIINAPKESVITQQKSTTHYVISMPQIERLGIKSLKNLSLSIPNFYLPEYGSSITSSMYVRGIGSRMNEPAIGLYIDNVPSIQRSSFDMTLHDIYHFQFLPGPQGTLYGRNSIAGMMNVYTLSPLQYQGTRISGSYGSYNEYDVRVSHYAKLTNNLGLSVSTYGMHQDGYLTNIFRKEKNKSDDTGVRVKMEWKMKNNWQSMLFASYDFTNQNAYPYAQYDTLSHTVSPIQYNEKGAYKRNSLSSGLVIQQINDKYVFTSATGFQVLADQMDIDQDFTIDSMLVLTQHQLQKTITQEFVLRSNNISKWQGVTGLFLFGTINDINAPMMFQSGGIDMIQGFMDEAKANNPFMPTLSIVNKEMPVKGLFIKPSLGAALYHQSSYAITDKLSVTAGVRVDYEHTAIDYDSEATLETSIKLPSPFVPAFRVDSTYKITGYTDTDFFQVLPKFALHYKLNNNHTLYTSLAKGHKAGGYNYSMFSDIIQAQMQAYVDIDVDEKIYYKPEESWNVELGNKGILFNERYSYQLALFYIQNQNQQLSTTTSNGSRMVSNAELAESYGGELSFKGDITDKLLAFGSYGYTHSIFSKYNANGINYKGKTVPFAPQNTIYIGAEYRIPIAEEWLDQIVLSSYYTGIGGIYWNVENTLKEDYYGILNVDVSFAKNNTHIKFWVKNMLKDTYNTFYFESLGNSFIQQGKPISFGVSAKYIL